MGHERSKQERTAYNHTCAKCGISHHHESVCRQSQQRQQSITPKTQESHDDVTVVIESLCSVSDASPMDTNAITLGHHIYNQFCNAWERRGSDPQPFIDVSIKATPEDSHTLGLPTPLLSTTSSTTYPAMADTGCQYCLAGTMKITAANNRRIDISGAWLSASPVPPVWRDTRDRQIVYFTDSSDRLFLSKQACIALGMIFHRFPTIGEATMPNRASVTSSATTPNTHTCILHHTHVRVPQTPG